MSTYKRNSLFVFFLFGLIATSLLTACGQSIPDLPSAAQINQQISQAESAIANAAASQLVNELPSSEEIAGRFASALPDGNTPINVTITDAQLNEQIATQQAANIDNLYASFSGGNIILNGMLNEPISGQISIIFRPYLVDSSVRFEVASATFGNMNVPSIGLSTIQTALNDRLVGTLNNLPATITVQELFVGDGVMTVVGNIDN